MTLDEFFADQDEARQLFISVQTAVEDFGPVELKVSKSQVAFRRGDQPGRSFALVWMPSKYLRRKAAPLVLTLSFSSRDDSPRWKEVVEPHPGRFTHHLELYSPADVDGEVRGWLRKAWEGAV